MMVPSNRHSISHHLFDGVDHLYFRNGDTNARKWLWQMELALRANLLFDVVQEATSTPQIDAWLTSPEPARVTQGDVTSLSSVPPLAKTLATALASLPSSSSVVTRQMAKEHEQEVSSEVEPAKKSKASPSPAGSAEPDRRLSPEQLDAVVSAMLLRYMEYDVAITYRGYSAPSIWRSVENMTRNSILSENEEFETQYAALAISSNESVREYFLRAKALMLKRRTGIEVTESAFVKHLLRGLRSRPALAEARAALLPRTLSESLTFWETLHYLEDREFTHRQVEPLSTPALLSDVRLKCTHCHKPGHDHTTCFQLHPELRKSHRHKFKKRSHATPGSNSSGKPKHDPSLTSIAATLSKLEQSISKLSSHCDS